MTFQPGDRVRDEILGTGTVVRVKYYDFGSAFAFVRFDNELMYAYEGDAHPRYPRQLSLVER